MSNGTRVPPVDNGREAGWEVSLNGDGLRVAYTPWFVPAAEFGEAGDPMSRVCDPRLCHTAAS